MDGPRRVGCLGRPALLHGGPRQLLTGKQSNLVDKWRCQVLFFMRKIYVGLSVTVYFLFGRYMYVLCGGYP